MITFLFPIAALVAVAVVSIMMVLVHSKKNQLDSDGDQSCYL